MGSGVRLRAEQERSQLRRDNHGSPSEVAKNTMCSQIKETLVLVYSSGEAEASKRQRCWEAISHHIDGDQTRRSVAH